MGEVRVHCVAAPARASSTHSSLPGSVPGGRRNYFNRVYYHRIGDPRSATVIMEKPGEREAVFAVEPATTTVWRHHALQGFERPEQVYLVTGGRSAPPGSRSRLLGRVRFIESAGDRLFFRTDQHAPNGRVVSVDPGNLDTAVLEGLPEGEDKLSDVLIVHHTLVASFLHQASVRIRLFTLTGRPAESVELPALGSITGLTGRASDASMYVGFTTFTSPPASFRYDFGTGALTPVAVGTGGGAQVHSHVTSSDYTVNQVWYSSADGTRVSMFLVHRRPSARRDRPCC